MAGDLYYGDNLRVLRESIKDESVDLIYLDPPFNSNANYNILFKSPDGKQSHAQIDAFEDTWHWTDEAEFAFDAVMKSDYSQAAIMLKAIRSALGENDMMAYLTMMAVRLVELHRVLKPTGSIYLHCDPTASHYLKIVLDGIFGAVNFRNEIVWQRTNAKSLMTKRLPTNHDIIFLYQKTAYANWNGDSLYQKYDQDALDDKTAGKYTNKDEMGRLYTLDNLINPNANRPNLTYEFLGVTRVWRWTKERMQQAYEEGLVIQPRAGAVPRYKRYLDEQRGKPLGDVWTDIPPLNSQAQERLGYPTQKPLSLLERIIQASSTEGDIVLDPFCGCGTSIHAAQKLERKWVGIDITHLAIALIEKRLKEAFPKTKYEIHGTPKDLEGAQALADSDKHEFQKWIVPRIGGQLYKGGQKGMDRGIDGYLHFRDADRKPQMAIISVKGGKNVSPTMVKDLKATVERESAKFGVFLTLTPPTREMIREASAAGLYETGGQQFPKLQILTVEDMMNGKRPQVPFGHTEGLKSAKRESTEIQGDLLGDLPTNAKGKRKIA